MLSLSDVITFITPFGTPDCLQISASISALKGDNLCGTITHVFPTANAAASLETSVSNALSQ